MKYLEEFKTFMNVDELNQATKEHNYRYRFELNKTDQEVFFRISQYAVKYVGAAHLKVMTLATILKKSSRTIQRSIKKLIELKIIGKIPFLRKVSGGFGANIYVILPPSVTTELSPRQYIETPTTPTVKEREIESEALNSLSTKKDLSFHDTYASQLPQSYYEKFMKTIKSTINDIDLGKELFRVYRAKTVPYLKFEAYQEYEDMFEDIGMIALLITLKKSKTTKLRSFPAFYSHVMTQRIEETFWSNFFYEYENQEDFLVLCTH